MDALAMNKMRFHVVALPHTKVTKEFFSCAYTEKVYGFCNMMTSLGHEVYLYASGDRTDANVTDFIPCLSEDLRIAAVGNNHYTSASFDNTLPHWKEFNRNAINTIARHIEQKDFICLIGGLAQKPIADAFPDHMSVEWGIGYSGTFAKYRVFESNTWRSAVYAQHRNAADVDINFYDSVVNGYYNKDEFPWQLEKEDYYLYFGRMTQRKGVDIASQACEAAGVRLIMAGSGSYIPKYGEYIGEVGASDRAKLLGGAIAAFSPTLYHEPFCNSHIQAMAVGTPVITTDLGIFTETVQSGFNGFRCNTLAEFVKATEQVKSLDPRKIATDTYAKYSTDMIRYKYDRYFNRLLTLWDAGWYTL
jgi:glycosyltransferase involved in cell wall biosynthesis